MAAYSAFEKLPVIIGMQSNIAGLCRMADTQTHALGELNRKLDTQNQPLNRKLDTIVVKLDRA